MDETRRPGYPEGKVVGSLEPDRDRGVEGVRPRLRPDRGYLRR